MESSKEGRFRMKKVFQKRNSVITNSNTNTNYYEFNSKLNHSQKFEHKDDGNQ